jgi:hypothetical protein
MSILGGQHVFTATTAHMLNFFYFVFPLFCSMLSSASCRRSMSDGDWVNHAFARYRSVDPASFLSMNSMIRQMNP